MYVLKLNDRYVTANPDGISFVTSTRQKDAVRLPDVVAHLARKDQGYLMLAGQGYSDPSPWRLVKLRERAPAVNVPLRRDDDRFDLGEWSDYPYDDYE